MKLTQFEVNGAAGVLWRRLSCEAQLVTPASNSLKFCCCLGGDYAVEQMGPYQVGW